jgi:hypothetical protein
MNKDQKQELLAKIMKNSLVEMPFSDFDDQVMLRIQQETVATSQSRRDRKRSSIFFALGCAAGMILSFLLSVYQWEGVQNGMFKLFAQVVFATILVYFVYQIKAFVKYQVPAK